MRHVAAAALMVVVLSQGSSAQEPDHTSWLGLSVGAVDPGGREITHSDLGPGYWVAAHLRIPMFAASGALHVEIGQWKAPDDDPRSVHSLTTRELGVSLLFQGLTVGPVSLVLGGGAHLTLETYRSTFTDFGFGSDFLGPWTSTTSRLMAHVEAGLEWRVVPRLALFATARYEGQWPSADIAHGTRGCAGVRIPLPKASASRARDSRR